VTELLGASFKQNWDAEDRVQDLLDDTPLLVVEDARAAFSFASYSTYAGAPAFRQILRETHAGRTRSLPARPAKGPRGAITQARLLAVP
jgi:hypothetical protein